MIGSVSNYTSYTSTHSTATQNARSQPLQKDLFASTSVTAGAAAGGFDLQRVPFSNAKKKPKGFPRRTALR